MSKLILTGICAAAALGLAACGGKTEENNVAIENVEDMNATDMNATDMNMTDMNATDMNATDMNMDMNATGNDTTTNTGY
jgi:hypothetical protein